MSPVAGRRVFFRPVGFWAISFHWVSLIRATRVETVFRRSTGVANLQREKDATPDNYTHIG